MVQSTDIYTFLNLAGDVVTKDLGQYLGLNELKSMQLTCKVLKDVADKILEDRWHSLMQNSPQGIVDIPHEITRIIDQEPHIKPLNLFKKLAEKFTEYGAPISNGLSITSLEFENLQSQTLPEQNKALLSIWPNIADKLQMPEEFRRSEKIRDWLLDENNAALLKEITLLNLNNLNDLKLRVFPPLIAKLTQLQALDLSNNQLKTLPDCIGALTELVLLNLSKNQFKTFPNAIGTLTGLGLLDLSNNQLCTLSDSIGTLKGLVILNLSNNQLKTLPDTIGTLTWLGELDLSNNKFVTIPNVVRTLPLLKTLKISQNPLNLTDAVRASTRQVKNFTDNLLSKVRLFRRGSQG
jgi:Leucine-rich repeat (LRR) protein